MGEVLFRKGSIQMSMEIEKYVAAYSKIRDVIKEKDL